MHRIANEQAYNESKRTRDEVYEVDSRERVVQHFATNPLQSFPTPPSFVSMLTPT